MRQTTTHTTTALELRTMHRSVGALLIASAVLLILPEALKGMFWLAVGSAALVVGWRRVTNLKGPIRRPLRTILIAAIVSLLAGLVNGIAAMVTGADYPFPSPSDLFTFTSNLLFIGAILMIVRLRNPRLSLDPILDALVGGVAVALLQWSLFVMPYLSNGSVSVPAKAMTVMYSLVSLMMIIAAVLALVAGSTPTTSNRLFAAALVVAFGMDIVAGFVTSDRIGSGTLVYVSAAIFVLGFAGLLHPSVRQLLDRPNDQAMARRVSRRRSSVLAGALLTPPLLLLWGVAQGETGIHLLLPALGAVALAPLVILRLARLVQQNEELATMEAGLRAVGERLVSAESNDDVARIITVGAEQVLGSKFVNGGLILDPLTATDRAQPDGVDGLLNRLRHCSEIEVPTTATLVDLSGSDDTSTSIAGLVVVQRDLRGAVVLLLSGPLSVEEENAISALCREAAIALRAVEQTERQVRQRSEDRFAALIDNSSDIVAILDADLHLSYVSPVAGRLLGYSLSDEPGEVSVMDLVHSDDRDAALGLLDDVRFGLRNTVEIRLRHSEGPYRWFEIGGMDLSSDPNIGGIVLNAREIDDRKQAEERLLLSEARFKSLVQNSTDLVIVLDPGGAISYASPSVTDVLAETPEQILGRPLDEVFRQSSVDWTSRLRTDPSRSVGSSELIEFNFDNAEGELRSIETSLTDLRAEPAVGGFVLNARDVTDRKSMEQRIRYQATHDELTGLANRVHVLDDLAGMLGRNSGSTTVAAILLGIDDFKDINDSLGHAFGDLLLTSVAERITAMLSFGDIAARVGGDEFVVVVERAHGESHVTDLAERLLTTIASPFVINGRELTVTASAGIVFDHDRTNTGDILLRNADIAMYRAKTMGKRQAVVFESQMHTASFDRLELRADLARAVTSEQFVAHYQPVFDLTTRRIVGCEALIRWDHPRRGLLGPGLFIPLAEESGLIGKLGEWILERACTDLATWRREYGSPVEDLTMSVNLSVQQLHDDGIVRTVSEILQRADLPAERLVLEVTESTLITDTEKIRATMHELRQLGTRLAVDDFGTGYSSLGYIQQFEFDVLKIDKSFVDDIDQFTNQRIVTAVLDLARQLGVRTIAEGIETELQAGLLEELGCRLGQGYLYSRPVPQADFRELLSSDRSASASRPVR